MVVTQEISGKLFREKAIRWLLGLISSTLIQAFSRAHLHYKRHGSFGGKTPPASRQRRQSLCGHRDTLITSGGVLKGEDQDHSEDGTRYGIPITYII